MSTENKISSIYSLPGRIKPLDSRSGFTEPRIEQPPAVTLIGWDAMQKKLLLVYNRDRAKRKLMAQHPRLIHELYDAWFQRAITPEGQAIPEESDKMLKIENKYMNPDSPFYSPNLMRRINPISTIMQDSFPHLRPRE